MPASTQHRHHCDTFLAANADRDVHKPVHRFDKPPVAELGNACTSDKNVIARRLTASLSTQQSSFEVWSALARLDILLSDYRRLAPRFSFEQLTGQPSVAAGNEYRRTLTAPRALNDLEAACSELSGEDKSGALGGARTMDIHIVRAGPWGGETGELVIEPLFNHAMAGMASLWILVHGEGTDGLMQVRLDVFEVARWAWAPDYMAKKSNSGSSFAAGLLDWSYLTERLAECLGAVPAPAPDERSFTSTAPLADMATDTRVLDALTVHAALTPILDRMD